MANKTPVNNQRADRGRNKKSGNVAVTVEQKREKQAKDYGIKPKTKAMVDLMHDDPKLSATEAYIRTHQTNNRKVASIEASKLLAKPSVIGYKDSAVKKAKRRIVSLVDSDNESIALKASTDILDRNEGKAVQVTESTQKTVIVKLDLSGARIGAHYIQPEAIKPPVEE